MSNDGVRLQKVLAAAGVGSRRKCEVLMSRGRVTVDDKKIKELGTRVDPSKVVIRVDGKRIEAPSTMTVIALNKPKGVITAMSDDRGRPVVGDLIPPHPRLFHVGRLDGDTTGLLLLTNDGDLAHKLTHPSFGVIKRYVAETEGEISGLTARKIKSGVVVDGKVVDVTKAKVLSTRNGRSVIEIEIHEGRNRIVRKLLELVGHPVKELTRTRFGPIELGRTQIGATRHLSSHEVAGLLDTVDLGESQ